MENFDRYGEMNEKLLDSGHLGIKRFFCARLLSYEDGALDKANQGADGFW